MKTNRLATVVLLLFVVASIGYLLAKEFGGPTPPPADAVTSPPAGAVTSAPAKAGAQEKVIVYYFHGGARCATCQKFEAYTEETIKTGFSDELKTRKVEWRLVNVEEAGNEHFVPGPLVEFEENRLEIGKKLSRLLEKGGQQ